MPTLTSLPLSLQARILRYLCDEENQTRRSALRGTNCFLPSREPVANLTLDDADIADSILPCGLLAPALASPILAAAAQRLLSSATSYLTDVNTESQLPLWVKAFPEYVKAVSVRDVGLQASGELSEKFMQVLIHKSCEHAVELFKALSFEAVRLHVLDLVHAPFHTKGATQDLLLSGLCTTLESNRATLTHLALPIYANSDLCARGLETATLPHLLVLSMEMRIFHNANDWRLGKIDRQFCRMMQAVAGHADRSCQLTTIKELRLLNLARAPCANIKESGCSKEFFRAVRTLRVSTRLLPGVFITSTTNFINFFSRLECLYWDRSPFFSYNFFEKSCTKLNEVHLCHSHWITGAEVGAEGSQRVIPRHTGRLLECIDVSNGKIRTLVSHDELLPAHLRIVAESCPNLEYFSLYITASNVHKLRGFIKKCERLTGLEVFIDEKHFGRLGRDDWQALGKACPNSHPRLSEVSIQTRKYDELGAPIEVVTDCFTEVVKRVGQRAQRLVFRAVLKCRIWSRIWYELSRILDACGDCCRVLRYLEVDIGPEHSRRIEEDVEIMRAGHERLRESKDKVVHSLPYLNKVNLGRMHRWSNEVTVSLSLPKHT